ncbi:hypothetical protein HAX54_049865 [Datura stramonium]|uniref:Uncharacterized protein n=1 Tax=Datura stramonium TaxID=4076 RepID=A0ABS8WN06_DATST|nr:hypothetical protein [Datura stramonium]
MADGTVNTVSVNSGIATNNQTTGNQKFKKRFNPNYIPNAFYDHCKFKGHYKVDCFKLIGYPPYHPKASHGDNRFGPPDNRFRKRREGVSGTHNAHNAMIENWSHTVSCTQVSTSNPATSGVARSTQDSHQQGDTYHQEGGPSFT